jgi:hypothetical protein
MASDQVLRAEYERLQQEGTLLAGRLTDLTQRATVYRQLFRDSGRNHVFPLIAAHGALWAKGYFQWGLRLGRKLVWQYFHSPKKRTKQLAALDAFADAFRDINRQVCVDTYANFHFTKRYGADSAACVSPDLLAALLKVHDANRAGVELNDAERLQVYTAHFTDEQQRVVGPGIEAALAALDWPLLRFVALRPWVRFAYFPRRQRICFHDFSQQAERVTNGRRAFDLGAEVGWDAVELALTRYALLSDRFFTQPEANYAALRTGVLAG